MRLVRWTPYSGLYGVYRDMDLLWHRLNRSFGDWPSEGWVTRGGWMPAVDTFTRDKDLVVRVELPGIDPEKDVDLTVQDGILTIRGERKYEEHGNGGSRFESSYGFFERSIPLPEGVKEKDIQASYEHGILEVVFPKAAELTAAKKIPIKVGSGRKALTARGRKA